MRTTGLTIWVMVAEFVLVSDHLKQVRLATVWGVCREVNTPMMRKNVDKHSIDSRQPHSEVG